MALVKCGDRDIIVLLFVGCNAPYTHTETIIIPAAFIELRITLEAALVRDRTKVKVVRQVPSTLPD